MKKNKYLGIIYALILLITMVSVNGFYFVDSGAYQR